jgi:hypothetical protein
VPKVSLNPTTHEGVCKAVLSGLMVVDQDISRDRRISDRKRPDEFPRPQKSNRAANFPMLGVASGRARGRADRGGAAPEVQDRGPAGGAGGGRAEARGESHSNKVAGKMNF